MFQKMCRDADEASGISAIAPIQISSLVSALAEDRKELKKRKPIFREPEINILKSSIRTIVDTSQAPYSYKCIKYESSARPKAREGPLLVFNEEPRVIQPFEVPQISWENELKRELEEETMIESETTTGVVELKPSGRSSSLPNSSQYGEMFTGPIDAILAPAIVPTQPFSLDITAFACLDDDLCDDGVDGCGWGAESASQMQLLPNIALYHIPIEETAVDKAAMYGETPVYKKVDHFGANASLASKPTDASAVKSVSNSGSVGNTAGTAAGSGGGGGSGGAGAMNTKPIHEYGSQVAMTKEDRAKKMETEKLARLSAFTVGTHDFTTSLIQKSRGAKSMNEDVPQMSRSSRTTVSILNHNAIALCHKNTKMDLTDNDLRCFHRPRLRKTAKSKPWQISYDGHKDPRWKKLIASGVRTTRSLDAVPPFSTKPLAYTDSEKQNLSLASGEFIIVEYIEEAPPVMLNTGMASAIINYCRVEDGAEHEEAVVRVSTVTQRRRVDVSLARVPQHLRRLLLHRTETVQIEQGTHLPKLPLGESKVITTDDDFPFLGKIAPGEMVSSMTNNLFKAPIFPHDLPRSDFLLVLHRVENNQILSFTVREIPKLFLCGQMEPQQVVPKPKPSMSKLQSDMMMLAAARYFKTAIARDGVRFRQVQEALLKFYRCKSGFNASAMKKLIKDTVAREDTVHTGTKCWFPIPLKDRPDEDDMEVEVGEKKPLTLEDLETAFVPEEVCLQESCNAADRKLIDIGIDSCIDINKSRLWLLRVHSLKVFRIDRLAHLVIFTETLDKSSSMFRSCRELHKLWLAELEELDKKLSIGRFIHERLLVAPWNTTDAFVNGHMANDPTLRLTLSGPGDPSGKGEGFAFVRIDKENAQTKRENVKLVNTDKDLRKLTRLQMTVLCKQFGLTENEIASLGRWDLVHIVREMSTKALEEGIVGKLSDFSRVNEASAKQEAMDLIMSDYRKRAQGIWDLQMISLSNRGDGGGMNHDDESDDDENDEIEDQEWNSGSETKGFEAQIMAQVRLIKTRAPDEKIREAEDRSELGKLSAGIADGAGKGRSGANDGKGLAPMKGKDVIDSTFGQDDGDHDSGRGPAQSGQGLAAVEAKVSFAPSRRPTKVVKRVIQTIAPDGSETIEVQYLIAPEEVHRVEKQNADRERVIKREDDGAFALDDDDDVTQRHNPAQVLRVKNLKKGMELANQELAKESMDNEYRPSRSTARSAGVQINSRLPQVQLAAKLEKAVLSEYAKPYSELFRTPVSPIAVPKYYEIIENPICLVDILDKIASFQYVNVQGLLADVELMVQNAEKFNGEHHVVTLNGKSLLKSLRLFLTHDLHHLGAEKDEYSVLATAIKKKYLQWKRQLPVVTPVHSHHGHGHSHGHGHAHHQDPLVSRGKPNSRAPVSASTSSSSTALPAAAATTSVAALTPSSVSAPASTSVAAASTADTTYIKPETDVKSETLVSAQSSMHLSQSLSSLLTSGQTEGEGGGGGEGVGGGTGASLSLGNSASASNLVGMELDGESSGDEEVLEEG